MHTCVCIQCNMLGDVVQASHSHSSVVWNNSMLIYGGLNSEDVAINSLYQISLEDKVNAFNDQCVLYEWMIETFKFIFQIVHL